MKYLNYLLSGVLFLLLVAPAQANVITKMCEDRDNDGRFGVAKYEITQPVSRPAIVQANIGTYNSCLTRKNQLSKCNGSALCTCEDWNNDGRFGVVKNKFTQRSSSVLRANIGNYYSCVAYKNGSYRDTADQYHACEDRDRDGRFGLVRYLLNERALRPSVIAANIGPYHICTAQKNAMSQCQGNNVCICEDRNRDGRFGVVKYQGSKVRDWVAAPNIGSYAQCLTHL